MKFLALSFILLAGGARAADVLVTNNLNSGAGSLRAAVTAAANGDRIVFDPSLAGQSIVLSSPISLIRRTLTIDGSGLANAIALSGNTISQIFSIGTQSVITLDSLVLRDGRGSSGGAINNSSQLTARRCVFLQNRASFDGGAIYNSSQAKLLLENSTFTANTSSQYGGALYFGFSGTFELRSCTIAGNTANSGYGSGIFANSTFTCRDSVIAGNGVVPVAAANVYQLGNLTPTGAAAGNFIGGDPLLYPLGNYGGPTPTMIPLAGSPLVDPTANATSSPLATDQRGSARVLGPRVDSGAVEWDPSLGFIVPSNGFSGAGTGGYPVTWSIEADADSFEIFLGTTSGALLKVGTSEIGRFNLPLEQAGTTYYWRIDAIRGGTRISGPEQSITTRPPFTVTTLADESDGSPDPSLGSGTSLREAILAAVSYTHLTLPTICSV